MMNQRFLILIVISMLFSLTAAFAVDDCIQDDGTVAPCPEDSFDPAEADYSDPANVILFFEQNPIPWNDVPSDSEFWGKIPSKEISTIPTDKMQNIPTATLADNFAQLSTDQKGALESTQISELMSTRGDIPLSIKELNPEEVISALQKTYSQNIHQLQTANYGEDVIIENGQLKTESGTLDLQKVSAGLTDETTIAVKADGRITLLTKTIDIASIDTTGSDFDIEVASYSSDPVQMILKDKNGNPTLVTIKIGTVTVNNGEMYLKDGTLEIDGEEIAISSDENVYLNSEKDNAINFETISCVDDTCTDPLRFTEDALINRPSLKETHTKITLKGNSYKVRFFDTYDQEQLIQMPKIGNAHLTIENFETVHVYKTDSRLLISALSVDPNLRTKFQPGVKQIIPPRVEIGEKLVHLRNAKGETHGYLNYGNAKVIFDQQTSLNDLKDNVKSLHSDLNENQIIAYLANTLGVKPEDFEKHGDAHISLFPPDKGKWVVNNNVGKPDEDSTVTYYNSKGELITTSIGEVDGESFTLANLEKLKVKPVVDGEPKTGWEKLFANGKKATVKKTVYSIGKKSGGLDTVEDSWTNAGYGNKGPYLTPGIVAIHPNNPWGYKIGDVLMGDDGYVYLVADTYLETLSKNKIDVYMSSGSGSGKYDQSLTGTAAFSRIGASSKTLGQKTTPGDVRTILSKYGQFPPGESAAETIIRTGNLDSASGESADKRNAINNGYKSIQTFNSQYNQPTYPTEVKEFFAESGVSEEQFVTAANYAIEPQNQYYDTLASAALMPHTSYEYNQDEKKVISYREEGGEVSSGTLIREIIGRDAVVIQTQNGETRIVARGDIISRGLASN